MDHPIHEAFVIHNTRQEDSVQNITKEITAAGHNKPKLVHALRTTDQATENIQTAENREVLAGSAAY